MNESDSLFHIGTRFYNTKEETEYPCNCLQGLTSNLTGCETK
jgi:hypothetical protein